MTPCPSCGTTYRHSDHVGCCSACREVFSGITAFDAHFGPRGEDGRRSCRDPRTATTKSGLPMFMPSRRSVAGKPLWTGWASPESLAAFGATRDRPNGTLSASVGARSGMDRHSDTPHPMNGPQNGEPQ